MTMPSRFGVEVVRSETVLLFELSSRRVGRRIWIARLAADEVVGALKTAEACAKATVQVLPSINEGQISFLFIRLQFERQGWLAEIYVCTSFGRRCPTPHLGFAHRATLQRRCSD